MLCMYVCLLFSCKNVVQIFCFINSLFFRGAVHALKNNNIQFITQFGPVGFIKKGTDI